jgi:hypothetical protein
MNPQSNGEKPQLLNEDQAATLDKLFDAEIESDDDLIALGEIFEEDE